MALLISYLRTVNGTPYGCIVAKGPKLEDIGVSLCNPKDKFNKHLARVKAEGRIGKQILAPNRKVIVRGEGWTFVHSVRTEVENGITRMQERAKKYFKPIDTERVKTVAMLQALVGKMICGILGDGIPFAGVVSSYKTNLTPWPVRLDGSFASSNGVNHREDYPISEIEALAAEVIEPGPYIDPKIGKWVMVRLMGQDRVGYLMNNSVDGSVSPIFPYWFYQQFNLDKKAEQCHTGDYAVKRSEIVQVYGPAY